MTNKTLWMLLQIAVALAILNIIGDIILDYCWGWIYNR